MSPLMRNNIKFFILFQGCMGEIDSILKDNVLIIKGLYKPAAIRRMFVDLTEGKFLLHSVS